MPMNCCIKNCSNNALNSENVGFFRFPKLRTKSKKVLTLSEERRKKWNAAINRKNMNTNTARVCSRHFISGKSANFFDNLNPDWVPSLHLGYEKKDNSNLAKGRFERRKNRDEKKVLQEVQKVINSMEDETVEDVAEATKDIHSEEEEVYEEEEYLEGYLEEINPVKEPTHKSIGTQTDLRMTEIDKMNSATQRIDLLLAKRELEIEDLKRVITKSKMGTEFFEESHEKTLHFTGFSHYLTQIRITKKARDIWSRLKLQARKEEKASKSTLKIVDMKKLLPTHEKQSIQDPLQESFLENIKRDSLHMDDNSQTSIQSSESYVSNDSDSINSFGNDHKINIENSALTSSDILVNSDANDGPDRIDNSAARDDLVNLENFEFVTKFSNPKISILENTTGETADTSRVLSKHKKLIRSIRKLSDKKISKEDVMRARKEQIEQETAHARELHSLEMEERKSLYALKTLQMREFKTQQRQLFQAQLNKINSF